MNQTTEEKSVVESSNGPDYAAITPGGKPPTEYSYAERRAELLQQIEDLGHPSALNQTELAERYDVSQQQISKDLDRLDEYVRGRLGRRRDLEIGSVLKRCMTGALEDGDWTGARKAATAYDEYLDRRLDTMEFGERIAALEERQSDDAEDAPSLTDALRDAESGGKE
jgi:hypothetical protein